MANVNANVNVTFQTQQAIAQLRQLTAEINAFNKQTFAANSAAAQQQRALNQALADGVKTSGHFRTSIVPVISAVDQFSNSIEKGKLTLGQYTRYAASQLPGMRRILTREFDMVTRVAEDRVKKLNTQFVALGESANGMQRALAMTPTSLNQFSAQTAIALQRQQIFNRLLRDGSTQLLNWGKNTQWAGRQLMVGFTIPLGLLGAQAAKVFQELEEQAISFKKVYGDIFTTDVEVEQNLAAVRELAAEMTKYGQSAKQTMEIANTAAQSGAKGAELLAATREATRLAVLGQMEQNQAIEATISLQTAFTMSNEELAQSINFLNMVENQTILSLDDISQSIPRVASVIKGFGGTVQDLSVLLVAMKEGGVSAAEGSNALKNSMARIISPTKNALEVSQKYGIALQDIVARNQGKVVPLFQELARVLETLGGQPRQEVLSAIFGKYQYARIGTLLSNIAKEGSQAAKAIELTTLEARDLAASAERELSVVEESVATKFTAALEKAKLALAPVGEEFLKALTPVLDVIGKLLTKFDELPGGIKTAIVAATAIIGGIAPIVLMVTGLVANGIANIGKFVLFLRKQIATLRGNGEQFKMYTSAELEAAAAAASLEGRTSSLTRTMLLQQPAIQSLITLYERLALAARATTAAMPTTMNIPTPRGGGFAAVAPKLPRAYRNEGGPIFQSDGRKTIVPGVGNTDTVPAMLTPGEFVINKEATRKNLPLIKAINSGSLTSKTQSGTTSQIQKFAGGGWVQLYKQLSTLISGARKTSTRSTRMIAQPGAIMYGAAERTSPGTSRSRFWESLLLPEATRTAGLARNERGTVLGHIYSKQFYKKYGSRGSGASPRKMGSEISGYEGKTLSPQQEYDLLANQFVLFDRKWNESLVSGMGATRGQWKQIQGTDMVSLLYMLRSRGVAENDAISIANKAAHTINTRISKTNGPIDEALFGAIVTGATVQTLKSKSSQRIFTKYISPSIGMNSGGKVPGVQYLMSGWKVQPYVRPKKAAGPRATELEKTLMQKRANAKVASGKQLDDLIFRRDKNGKLDLDSTELLTMLSSNPNITDKQLSQIVKYHGSRIKTGVFGRFDKNAGIRFRDSDWGVWKDISKILEERGYPVIQSKNYGGMINKTLRLNKGNIIPGMGNKDTVPAMLTPGEFVVNKKSTQQNLPLLHAINSGNVRKYADGDEVAIAQGSRRRLPGEARVSWQEEVSDPRLSERQRIAEQARAGRAARTGFQVQREHTQEKTSFERGTTRWGTAPENQISNILKNSERTRNEYMKRLDKYFAEEKKRVEKSDRTQAQKDRMKENIDKKRDTMMQKINSNFALNARERQDQARVLSGMVRDIEQGKLSAGRGGAVSANFAKEAAKAVEAAKSYLIPSRPGLPGAVPLVPPTIPPTPMKTPVAPTTPAQARQQSRQERRNQRIEREAVAKAQKLAERRAELSEVKRRALEIKQERKIGSQEAMSAARSELGIAEKVKQTRMQRIGTGVKTFGMGAGMAISMGSMIPAMAADEQGKFLGMDAGTVSMGMMGAGTLLSVLPMLGAAAGPVAAVAGGLGAVALGAKILNDRMIEAAESAAEFGSNVGGTANALNTMAALFGEKTPAQRSTQMQLQFSAVEQEQAFGEFQNYLSSELGTKFLKDFESLTSAERFEKLSDYIRSAIAGGVLDKDKAILFAKTIGASLDDAILGSAVIADLRKNTQIAGAKGLLGLAEKRQAAVEERATTNQSEMIGSSIQIIQDYANALALANEEFTAGIISYEEFTKIAQQAKTAQKEYSKELADSLLINQMGRGGAITTTSQAGAAAFNKEMEKILTEEQMNAMKQATESGVFRGTGPAIGGLSASAFEGMMKAQIGSAIAAGVNPDQVIAIAQEIRDNPEGKLGQTYAKLIAQGSENALVVSAFEETSDVMAESLGLTDDMNEKFKELGRTFLNAGGNLGEFQTFIANLPETLRNSMIESLNRMSPEAQMTAIKGGTAISGAYGERAEEVFSSKAYKEAVKGAEGRRVRGGIIGVSKEDVKNLEDVQKTFVDLQKDFGEDTGIQISVAADTLQNGKKVDVRQWNIDAANLSGQAKKIKENFPPEILSQITIKYTDPKEIEAWSKASAVFAQNVTTISQLNPNIDISAVIRFLTLDAQGNELTPDQVAANTIKLNKAWKQLESSKDIKIRRQAMITIVAAFQDEEGNTLGTDFTTEALARLEEKFGGKVYQLDPILLRQSIQYLADASNLRETAQKLRNAGGGMGGAAMAAQLEAQANALEGTAFSGVKTGISNLDLGTGAGGGGGAESPLKGFVQNILEQVKMWVNGSAQIGNLNSAKSKFVDMVLKGQGIFDKLKNVKGIDPTRLEEILGMGPKGVQEFLDKYVKSGKLTKAGKTLLDAASAAGIRNRMGMAAIQTMQTQQQTRAANVLSERGVSTSGIEAIAGDTGKAADIVRLQKEYNAALRSGNDKEIDRANKALNRYIRTQLTSIQAEKDRGEAFKSTADRIVEDNDKIIAENNKLIDKGDEYFDKEERAIRRNYRDRIKSAEDQIDLINDQIDAVNKLIDEEERLNQIDQNRIRGLERQKEMLNRQLEEIERANELDQRKIDTLQREDEMRSRVAEALNRELDNMSRAEEEIRDSYQKRIDALDKIANVNDYIINQQRQQLGLSQAISEGDIYAATAAAQEMRASSAEFATEQVRQGLQMGMENQIANLRTSQGLTREQAEAQIRAIEEQSYQTSLKIRDIEDQIYNRTLSMIPIKDQIRNIDLQVRDIQDIIFDRETKVLNLQTQKLGPLQQALAKQQEILTNLNNQVDAEIDALRFNGMNAEQWADNKELLVDQNKSLEDQNTLLREEDMRLAGISRKWNRITQQIKGANRAARKREMDTNAMAAADIANIRKNTALTDTQKSQAIAARTKARLQELRRIEDERRATTDSLLEQGGDLSGYATGGLVKYGPGGRVRGDGSRDSVKAKLTPGEFVVRKSIVDKYGKSVFEKINQGSFDLIKPPRKEPKQIEKPFPPREIPAPRIPKPIQPLPPREIIPPRDLIPTPRVPGPIQTLPPKDIVVPRPPREPRIQSMPVPPALTQPSFSVPTYTMPENQSNNVPVQNIASPSSTVNAPVYNTYDVKFSISGANANPDEIANKVMFKMKQIQRQGVRGNRGY